MQAQVAVQQLASDPGAPFEGQVWENTTTFKLKARLNGATVILRDTGTPITDTDVAAANKDGVAGTASLRTLGTGAQQAMAGNTRLDTIASPTGSVSLNSQKITGLQDGSANSDAATVGQLNSVAAGLDTKASVRVATTAAGTLASSFANGQSVDGITLATGDRILIKNQASASENGIYVVAASGSPTRATDFDAWTEIPGALVAAEVGSTNADKVFISTADQGGTLNTTAITFTILNPTAGAGLTKYAQDITGNGATTQFTVTHSLSTTDVQISVYDVANDLEVLMDKKRPTANTVRLDFAVAPANLKVYRVVVIG